MTILITGYVLLVGVFAYYQIKLRNELFDAECRTKNFRKWLAQSEQNLWDTKDELRTAYRVIDRMQDERDGTSFAEEIGSVIDEQPNVIDHLENAGAYFDDDGMPKLDQMDWTPQNGVTYSESDDSDV